MSDLSLKSRKALKRIKDRGGEAGSLSVLARMLGFSLSTIRDTVKELEDFNLVKIEEERQNDFFKCKKVVLTDKGKEVADLESKSVEVLNKKTGLL